MEEVITYSQRNNEKIVKLIVKLTEKVLGIRLVQLELHVANDELYESYVAKQELEKQIRSTYVK